MPCVDTRLSVLDGNASLTEKLHALHHLLRARYEFIHRISVAVHDPGTDLLKTLICSSDERTPLRHYQAPLSEVPSLQRLSHEPGARIVHDLREVGDRRRRHTRRLLDQGMQSSYTLPIHHGGRFFGFVFMNSRRPWAFPPELAARLEPYARLLAMTVVGELETIGKLKAMARGLHHITARRDRETGLHLERMARYSRLIALALAPEMGLDDEYVEHVFLFAPLHDLGKIAIPDRVLLKPGSLDPDERALMQSHAVRGAEIAEYLVREFGLEGRPHLDILRNIVRHHHEALNGQGYPDGLRGTAIPLEARVVAVADIFDALTSERPYKPAWSNRRAFAELRDLARQGRLDPRCVRALVSRAQEIETIQARFGESPDR